MAANFPVPSKASLVQQFVGKSLKDIPLPAAVLDIAAVKRNCARMLDAVTKLGFALRPIVSSHKTTEITRLQIGEDPDDVRLLVTTLSEAENLLPLLIEYQRKGLQVNILYNVPISLSQVERVANVAKILGKRGGNVRLLVDHPSQIPLLLRISELSGYPPYVYIGVDMGNHHSGLEPQSPNFRDIFRQIEQIVLGEGPITIAFVGFYCVGNIDLNQYGKIEALKFFEDELLTLLRSSTVDGIRLSVRDTPIITYLPQLLEDNGVGELGAAIESFRRTMGIVSDRQHQIEVHADGYPLLDLRQLATLETMGSEISAPRWADMPLTILTEVASLYPSRGIDGTPEALITAGKSAFSRVSDGASPGWGIVNQAVSPAFGSYFDNPSGWQIGRIEKESAVLVWNGRNQDVQPLHCGQRLVICPNDAASASEGFGWYFVVDSSTVGRRDEIVDIFVKWRG